MRRIFQLVSVSFFIVGFPLISWYYLNKGYDYRVAVLKELKQDLGTIPDFDMQNQKGKNVDQAILEQRVVVASFMDIREKERSENLIKSIFKIQDQFDQKDEIVFCTFVQKDSISQLADYVSALEIESPKTWYFLSGTEEAMYSWWKQFPMPDYATDGYAGQPVVAIADTSGVIRHFYDMRQENAPAQLIEHIAVLMPQAPSEKARMRRELEK